LANITSKSPSKEASIAALLQTNLAASKIVSAREHDLTIAQLWFLRLHDNNAPCL
jgi:hypothetical protein